MKKVELHPLSVTVGAVAAFVLLFACSSGSSPATPTPTHDVTTQVTFYSETRTQLPLGGPYSHVFTLGTATAATVITDVSWDSALFRGRLLVNGTPVYGWGLGGSGSNGNAQLAGRFTLAHGIKVPAGSAITVEVSELNLDVPSNMSLAGYTL